MDLQLNGKRAIVTGSTAGIGRAIATALLDEGAEVVINGRRQATVDKAVGELRERGPVHGVAADLGKPDGVRYLAAEARKHGPVDILINNVGIFEPRSFEQIPDEDWQTFYEVNVLSGVRASRALMGGMRERGWGRIVFISSESGINIPEEMVHYGMTKTAQLAVSRGLAKVLKGTGVTVNSVLPGPTLSEGVGQFVSQYAAATGRSADEMRESFVREARPSSLIDRFAEPEEVAALVAFLCSPRASAITGTAQRVDGGVVNTCF